MEALLGFLLSGEISAHPKAYRISGLRVVHHEHVKSPAHLTGEEVQVVGTFAKPGIVFASQITSVREGRVVRPQQS